MVAIGWEQTSLPHGPAARVLSLWRSWSQHGLASSISFRKSARRCNGLGIVRLAIHLVVLFLACRLDLDGPDFRATSR